MRPGCRFGPIRPHAAKRGARSAFTLIELLVVISIISLLIAILVPSLSRARDLARSTMCLSVQRNQAVGFQMYQGQYNGVMVPGRFGGGASGDAYWVGNGWKYRPRWVAAMGVLVGSLPFETPSPVKGNGGDRQDYTRPHYLCPSVPDWADERNYAFGYNYQFLGNARTRPGGAWRHFPVSAESVRSASGTVMAADSIGTASAFPSSQRLAYENDGTNPRSMCNHGWSLDPPRLTSVSDRGPGDTPGDPRISVHGRHLGKVNASFCDGHAESRTAESLGYQIAPDGSFTDAGHNRLFSGDGEDRDPPVVW